MEFLESTIGHAVPWYDLLLSAAVILGFYLGLQEADRKNIDRDAVFRAGIAVAIVAFVAGRLYVVFTHADQFAGRPLALLQVWEGGTGSTGVYLGGFIAALVAARWQHLSPTQLLDCAAPATAAGLALGRTGCFLNGCCFGEISELPWAVRYPEGSAPQLAQAAAGMIGPAEASLPVHPVQLYEAAYGVALFLLLWRLRRARMPDGALVAVFFLLYPLGRFFSEMLRGDARPEIGGLSLPQVFCAVAVVTAGGFLVQSRLHRPGGQPCRAATATS
jgi:phosphatidylglycerol:prolipoprotein diacylglycerol transferase